MTDTQLWASRSNFLRAFCFRPFGVKQLSAIPGCEPPRKFKPWLLLLAVAALLSACSSAPQSHGVSLTACYAGDLSTCDRLGRTRLAHAPEQAITLLAKACDGGIDASCTEVARLYLNGEQVRRELVLSASIFQQSCDRGDAIACAELGRLVDGGVATNTLSVRTLELYQRSCEAGAPLGCYFAGVRLVDGDANLSTGLTYLQSACNDDIAPACLELGLRFEDGRGLERSSERALSNYTHACELGDGRGCNNAGALLESEQGDVDRSALFDLYHQGCETGSMIACVNGGRLLVDSSPKVAASMFKMACTAGESRGCVALGGLQVAR